MDPLYFSQMHKKVCFVVVVVVVLEMTAFFYQIVFLPRLFPLILLVCVQIPLNTCSVRRLCHGGAMKLYRLDILKQDMVSASKKLPGSRARTYNKNNSVLD